MLLLCVFWLSVILIYEQDLDVFKNNYVLFHRVKCSDLSNDF